MKKVRKAVWTFLIDGNELLKVWIIMISMYENWRMKTLEKACNDINNLIIFYMICCVVKFLKLF